jgi:hypothetical protein
MHFFTGVLLSGSCSVFIKGLEGGPTCAFCIPFQLSSKKLQKYSATSHIYIKQSISPPSYTLSNTFSLYVPSFPKSQQGTVAAFVPLSLSNQKKPHVHVILLYVGKSRHIGKVKKRERKIPNVRRNQREE